MEFRTAKSPGPEMGTLPCDVVGLYLTTRTTMADAYNIDTLGAVTGADEDTCRVLLESFNGDLDRAANYFMENGLQGVATLATFTPIAAAASAQPVSEVLENPIDLSSPAQAGQSAADVADQHRNRGWQEEEAALQRALEASQMSAEGGSRGRGGNRTGTATPRSASQRPSSSALPANKQAASDSDVEEYEPSVESDVEMDTEEEYLRKLAAAQQRRMQASSHASPSRAEPSGDDGAGPSGFGMHEGQDELPRIRRNRPSGAAAGAAHHMQALNAFSQRLGVPMPPMGHNADDIDEDYDDGAGPSGMDQFGGFPGGRDSGLPDLPVGVDIEEARMLEAAMLGIPYTGRMPDFANGGGGGGAFADPFDGAGAGAGAGAEPMSPGLRAQRALQEEQDWAYQASLQADREKSLAEEAAQRAAVEESARQAAEAEAIAAQAAAAADAHQELLALKASKLPEEPPAGPDAVTVLIRLPNGRRLTRRFLKSDQLHALFDFVDTSEPGEELRPGSYILVSNMPRTVHEETSEKTLAEVGLTSKQEALMLESKA